MILNIFMHTLHYENCFFKLNSKFDETIKSKYIYTNMHDINTQSAHYLTHTHTILNVFMIINKYGIKYIYIIIRTFLTHTGVTS